MPVNRTDQERVTVNINGTDFGVWDAFSGGGVSSEDTKNRPGGMEPEESLGGPKSRDAFTVSRLFRADRDLPAFVALDQLCGSGRVVAKRQALNSDRSPAGSPITYTGTLMKVTPPDHDSNSGDRATFSIEVSADEAIAQG